MDAINRQAAIDAITKWEKTCVWDDWCDDHRDESERYHIIPPSTVIRTLPSAEPEIIRCKECKYWKDSDGVYRRGFDAESKCPLNLKKVYEGTFYCGMAERRTDESD